MAEAAFIVPLLPHSLSPGEGARRGWRLLCHYEPRDSAARVQIRKRMNHSRCVVAHRRVV
ncbi:MAG: hypothetical protein ACJ788_03620 [Ktedonobacteraceae bacterium]